MRYQNKTVFQGLLLVCLAVMRVAVVHAEEMEFPKASEGFSPKIIYAAKLDDIWGRAISALSANGFQIATASKETTQISTDFKTGPSTKPKIGGALLSRYKYVVSVVSMSPTQTRVTITPTVEFRRNQSSFLGMQTRGDAMWHDSTNENPELVANLKNWLYEQLER
jgi:uncharacterized lipoprotein